MRIPPGYGGSHIARDALYLAHGGQALDAHGVASFQLTVVVGLRLVLCIAKSGCCFLLVLRLFRLALGMALLALLYLSYLASYLVIVLLGVYLLHLLLEGIEFLADALGLLLLRLTLTNLSDGILYLLVALLQEFLGLLLRLGENLLATLLDLLDVALILGDGLLHILLTLMDALSLVLPVSLVSHDVLQVLVALDVL